MGKAEEEYSLPTTVDAQNTNQNAFNRCRFDGLVKLRCVLALFLGCAVFLSAIFWLPPFLHSGDQKDLDLDSQFGGHDIVASFMVEKPVSFLEDNILRLEDDIFDEIGLDTTKVEIIYLGTSAGSNITKVVFAVDSDVKNPIISTTAKSLIRASFVSLVINQSSLRLTASLFGDPFSFEVLKFTGGITVSPPQSAFLMQKVQILFNFTLNFSIDQIQNNFYELTSQLKSGLHLGPYENLYISLTNLKGSTVASPTTVQSQVLLAVGINPSKSRLKQLAQTITNSPTKNLGLNNTVFGRVKQVRLSSILQHSLGGDGSGSLGSPSPAPLPHPHRRHHHHHHHHHHDAHQPPTISPAPGTGRSGTVTKKVSPTSSPMPAPAPASEKSHEAEPPACHFGYRKSFPKKENKHSHAISPVAPPVSPKYTAPSPQQQVNPPAPAALLVPASSPLPNVVFSHVHPPSKSEFDAEPPDITALASPSPSPSSAGLFSSDLWVLPLFIVLVLHQ